MVKYWSIVKNSLFIFVYTPIVLGVVLQFIFLLGGGMEEHNSNLYGCTEFNAEQYWSYFP